MFAVFQEDPAVLKLRYEIGLDNLVWEMITRILNQLGLTQCNFWILCLQRFLMKNVTRFWIQMLFVYLDFLNNFKIYI